MKENFYIDRWLIQPSLNRVSLGDNEWKLEPKIMQVLCELASTPGKVVTRDHLFDTVWENTVVVEMVLTRAISELRSIFKDSPTSPNVIETIPKGGYRIIATIRAVSERESQGVSFPKSNTKYVIAGTALVIITLITILSAKESIDPVPKSYNALPFTSLKGWEYEPDISADGKSVVFLWKPEGQSQTQICTKLLGSADHKILTENFGQYFSPKWSPNGDQIAFYTIDNEKVLIKVMPAYGGTGRDLIEVKAQIAALSWSPDGQKLAFVQLDTIKNRHAIYVYSLEDKTSIQMTSPPENYWGDSSPKFSKDGNHLAFIRSLAEGRQDLYSISLENHVLKQVTDFNSNIFGFDWDNQADMVFSTDFDGQVAMWKIHPGNLSSYQKLPFGKDKRNPSIVGTNLVMEEWKTDTDLWRLDLDGDANNARPILQSTQWDIHPDISRNGKKIAFSSNQSGQFEIWSSNANGQHLKKLTSIAHSLTGNPKWAPKGDVIAFDAIKKDFSHIYIVDSMGTDQYQFTRGKYNDLVPSWNARGDQVYFASDRSGRWEVWKKTTNGNIPTQITFNGGFFARESEDGRHLLYTKRKQNGLWKMDLSSGDERLLIPEFHQADWGNWQLHEDDVYYISRLAPQQGVELRRFNLRTQKSRLVVPLQVRFPRQDATFSIAPDGRWIIYGQVNGYHGDLVHVNNL